MQNNIHNLHDKFVNASFSDVDRAAATLENALLLIKGINGSSGT